jgi:SAM-dependent methyltransferase
MKYLSSYEKTAHLYDIFDQKANIEFHLKLVPGAGEVLDIGAGTGRIAVPLAKIGVRMYCVEPSPAMRREFKKKMAGDPLIAEKIILVGGDAATFAFERAFPVAIMSGVFDHMLDDGARLAVLRNVWRHLMPGGRLIFDLSVGRARNRRRILAGEYNAGEKLYRRFVSSRKCPGNRSLLTLEYEVYRSGMLAKRIKEKGFVAFVTHKKIRRLLCRVGFQILDEYGGYDFSDYKQRGECLVIDALRENRHTERH